MNIGKVTRSIVYDGSNLCKVVESFPFYVTRDDQPGSTWYTIRKCEGKARLCSGICEETRAAHIFTNIGTLNIDVGEYLEFMDIE